MTLLAAIVLAALMTPAGPAVAEPAGRPAAAPAIPPPTPEHAVLHRLLGEWKARMEVYTGGSDKPDKARATETVRTCCGGLFVLTELNDLAMKSPRGGRGILGYDPIRRRYILAWADDRSTTLELAAGDYDEASDAITFVYEQPDAEGGARQLHDVFAWDGPDRRSRTISATDPDGTARPLVAIQYRRK